MLVRLVVVVALIVVATLTASLAMAQSASRTTPSCDPRHGHAAMAEERVIAPLASIAR
jgi:hypothetical protein